jgi:hypothetical protein
MENNRLVGIVTGNDLFYRIMNPILGIGKPGSVFTSTIVEKWIRLQVS